MPSCWWLIFTEDSQLVSTCYIDKGSFRETPKHRNTIFFWGFQAEERTPGDVFGETDILVPRYTSPKSKFWKGVHECDCPTVEPVGARDTPVVKRKEWNGSSLKVPLQTARCPPCVGFFGTDKHICLLLFFCWNGFSSEVSTLLSFKVGTLSAHVGGRPFWWVRFRDAVVVVDPSIYVINPTG